MVFLYYNPNHLLWWKKESVINLNRSPIDAIRFLTMEFAKGSLKIFPKTKQNACKIM